MFYIVNICCKNIRALLVFVLTSLVLRWGSFLEVSLIEHWFTVFRRSMCSFVFGVFVRYLLSTVFFTFILEQSMVFDCSVGFCPRPPFPGSTRLLCVVCAFET